MNHNLHQIFLDDQIRSEILQISNKTLIIHWRAVLCKMGLHNTITLSLLWSVLIKTPSTKPKDFLSFLQNFNVTRFYPTFNFPRHFLHWNSV